MFSLKRDNLLEKRKDYYLIYTGLFVVFFIVAFVVFFYYGKAPVWSRDGLTQHFPNYVYAGEWFREIISGLINNGGLNIKEWDATIGLGQDVFNVVSFRFSYLFSIFATSETLVAYLWIVIAVGLYCSGIAFSEYCFYMKANRFSTLVAVLLYVFSSYSLVYSPKHYMFIGFLIFLPMICLGIEKSITEGKKAILILSAFLSAWTYFYIFYIVAVFAVFYYIIRFITREGKCVKLFLKEIITCGIYGLLGFLLAAASWLRVIVLSMESGRYGSEVEYSYTSMWHYLGNYYIEFFKNIFSTDIFNLALILGLSGMAGICGIYVFVSGRKKYIACKVGIIVTFLMMMMPFGSYLFNGFSGKNDRWSCILTFLTSVIIAFVFPKLFKLEKNKLRNILCVEGCYFILLFICHFIGFEVGLEAVFSILLINALVIWGYLKPHFFWSKRGKVIILLAVFLEILVKSLSLYTPMNSNYLAEFHDSETIEYQVESVSAQALKDYEDTDVYRVDEVIDNFAVKLNASNYGLRAGVNGLSTSYSYITGGIQDFVSEVGVASHQSVSFMVIGLNNRTILNTLSSVKYAVTLNPETEYMPGGYELVDSKEILDEYGEKQTAYIYENKFFLPYMFAYDNAINKNEYEQLNAVQKESALLEGIVLEDSGNYPTVEIEDYTNVLLSCKEIVEQLQVKYGESKRVVVENGKIEVPQGGAYIELTFEGIPYSETYILFDKVEYIPVNPMEYKDIILDDHVSLLEERKYGENALSWEMPSYSRIGYGNQTLILNSEISQYYCGGQDAVINLGYSETGKKSAILYFSEAGTYTFEDMKVLAYPMGNYVEKIERLRANSAQNILLTDDGISGDITLEAPKYVCINIPYSEGWKAYINGEEVEVHKANGMYMAVYAEQGNNHIDLVYYNRGLRAGFVVTGVSMVILGCLCLIERVIKKRKKGMEGSK